MADNNNEIIKILSKTVTKKLIAELVKNIPFLGGGIPGMILGKILQKFVGKVLTNLKEVKTDMEIKEKVRSEYDSVIEARKGINKIDGDSKLDEIREMDKKVIDSYRIFFNV